MDLPIYHFTDFGLAGPYVGQMHAVIRASCDSEFVCLQADAPAQNARASAYLLRALVRYLPVSCVVLAVVDPGVGSERDGLVLRVGERYFVGPDNGLLSRIEDVSECNRIAWRPPEPLSDSFHGRDWFAPVAARLALGQTEGLQRRDQANIVGADWPWDLHEVIYCDAFGNLVTGIRSDAVDASRRVVAAGNHVSFARTFSDAGKGQLFWYRNSIGLIELAANQASAVDQLRLEIGAAVTLE